MIGKDEIRTILSDIRFYYANIRSFQNASRYIGENRIVKRLKNSIKPLKTLRRNFTNCIFIYTQITGRWRPLPLN